MEILIKKFKDGSYAFDVPLVEITDRLSAYEDTGLEPEEIEKANKVIVSAFNLAVNSGTDMLIERLKEIIQAEHEGRLVVLPCKVGTAVYQLDYNQHDGYWIEPHFFKLEDVSRIGKTVFLTREEAEAALKEE